MIKIIANKKVDLTPDEWREYEIILNSYDQKLEPKTFFEGLFESDSKGKIVFLHPPKSGRMTFEVYLFIVNVMLCQQLREMNDRVDDAIKDLNAKFDLRIEAKVKELMNKVNMQ